MIPEQRDLTQEVIDKLPRQFYDKVNLVTLLSVFGDGLKDQDTLVFDIVNNVNVDTATGYLLDCVGSYVAVLRNKDDDETYRERIKRRLLTATSGGTPNNLLEALAFITKGDTKIWEHYPISTALSSNGTVYPSTLSSMLKNASPVTSTDVVVYMNPFQNCFIPSELGFDVLKLGDKNLDYFITNNTENIVVNNLIYGGEGTLFADLSEFTYGEGSGQFAGIVDGKGILCELVYSDKGVTDYNHEYVSLDNTINAWYLLMNYEVQEEFN